MSDSAPVSVIASGEATVRPRPMKRMRSVSNEVSASVRAVHGHQVKHPRHLLVLRTRTASAEDCVPTPEDLGLHEQVAECGVQRIGSRGRENHLGVARDVDRPRRIATGS